MSIPQENPITQPQAAQATDKELNFRKLEERYERMLQEERQKRVEAENAAQKKFAPQDDEEEDNEPYVDRRRLKKEIANTRQTIKQETQTDIQKAVGEALEKERQEAWIEANSDFYEVMQHAEALAKKAPGTAKTILKMPEGFERQKLVYNAIKEFGINKKEEPKSNIQEEIKNNKKGLYYSPSGVGSAPYHSQGDFSPGGQKSAYDKMQELKNRLRAG
jgi:hypothetical protein